MTTTKWIAVRSESDVEYLTGIVVCTKSEEKKNTTNIIFPRSISIIKKKKFVLQWITNNDDMITKYLLHSQHTFSFTSILTINKFDKITTIV